MAAPIAVASLCAHTLNTPTLGAHMPGGRTVPERGIEPPVPKLRLYRPLSTPPAQLWRVLVIRIGLYAISLISVVLSHPGKTKTCLYFNLAILARTLSILFCKLFALRTAPFILLRAVRVSLLACFTIFFKASSFLLAL